MSTSKSVDEYIASQPKAAQVVLRRVRNAVRKALPEAEEVISYQIPAFRQHGRIVIFFAAWKQHYAIYPALDAAAAFKDELVRYKVSKGTIRFPFSDPVPVNLIERIAKFRAKVVAQRQKPKAARRTASP
ncbi:MAG: iron chaperone [Bryobacteraceae bacterium]